MLAAVRVAQRSENAGKVIVLLAPVPAGMSLEYMEESLRAVFARFHVKAATLAVYDPDHDQDGKTLRTALRLIEIVAEGARGQRN